MIVAAIRINRSHERTLLAFGPQPRIDPRQISLGARLRHRRQELLRLPVFLSDEQHVEVGAITDFFAAEFSQRDDGQLITTEHPIDRDQQRFSQSGSFPANRGRVA